MFYVRNTKVWGKKMLVFSAGDRITVIDDSNEEWWRVSLGSWSLSPTSRLCCQAYRNILQTGCGISFKSSDKTSLFVPPGKDQRENRLHTCQLHHQGTSGGGRLQGDTLLCWQQRDGPDHAEERPGWEHVILVVMSITHYRCTNKVKTHIHSSSFHRL